MLIRFGVLALLILLIPIAGLATTWHIYPDGSGDAPTIQAGIDSTASGDSVLVACGTYYEHDIVMNPWITLRSETGLAECVTIDAQQQGRVLYCSFGDYTASIEGFTITGGLAPLGGNGGGIYCYSAPLTLTNCIFSGNSGEGIFCFDSGHTITNCIFSGNSGGGIAVEASGPDLTNCAFSGNSGAGMSSMDSSPTLMNCIFSDNLGGGMYTGSSATSLTNCIFLRNVREWGGGLCCETTAPVILTHCAFYDNSAARGGAVGCYGGGSPTLRNCTLSGNMAEIEGGGVFCGVFSAPLLENTIIAFGAEGEAVYCDDTSSATLTCCDIYNNADGDWVGCIANQYDINGNISEDPLFCALDSDDFTLQDTSPCAPENNSECGLIGTYEIGCLTTSVPDPTPREQTTWGQIKATYR